MLDAITCGKDCMHQVFLNFGKKRGFIFSAPQHRRNNNKEKFPRVMTSNTSEVCFFFQLQANF